MIHSQNWLCAWLSVARQRYIAFYAPGKIMRCESESLCKVMSLHLQTANNLRIAYSHVLSKIDPQRNMEKPTYYTFPAIQTKTLRSQRKTYGTENLNKLNNASLKAVKVSSPHEDATDSRKRWNIIAIEQKYMWAWITSHLHFTPQSHCVHFFPFVL